VTPVKSPARAGRGGRDQAGGRGQQRGVGEDGLWQEAGGRLVCGRVGVVPAVCVQGAGDPGVDVGLDVSPGAAGELVTDGFVALAGLGLLQRARLAQRLELIGARGRRGARPCCRSGSAGAGAGGPARQQPPRT